MTGSLAAADPLDLARRLARGAGVALPERIERLAGGKNNRVFRVDLADGRSVVMKSYHVDQRDTRNRLHSEWRFLQYVWGRGVRAVPEPLARDDEAQTALYSFSVGRKLHASEIDHTHIDAAIAFIEAINGQPVDTASLPVASEACFTIGEHLSTVQRRIARLGTLDADATGHAAAEAFIMDRLMPAWEDVSERVGTECAAAGLDMSTSLEARTIILSPSDFGFHNALVADTGAMIFLDFEYAGADDPAKLLSDFACQPEIPVPAALAERFAAGVEKALGFGPLLAIRRRLLLDVYRIKWICIMLNDYLPMDAARRAFAAVPGGRDDRASRARTQLAKAELALAAIDLRR